MKKELLALLQCPSCKRDLSLQEEKHESGEIKEGALVCPACLKRYPVRDFVPRFVDTDRYAKSFSLQWDMYRQTQLDSASGRDDSRRMFVERMGTAPENLKGMTVLDVGCGTGRLMEVASPHAKDVIGIDLSFAVDRARENLKRCGNTHVLQADVFNLPFKEGIFDYIYSMGVLHHTADTRQAFLMLPPLLKEGGEVAIWVYPHETLFTKIKNAFSGFYRVFTTRMPPKLLWYACHAAIPLYHVKRIKFLRTALDCVLPAGNDPDPRWRVLDTFDWYSPKFQYKHSYSEVMRWFEEAGLCDIRKVPFLVSVRGKKRAGGIGRAL